MLRSMFNIKLRDEVMKKMLEQGEGSGSSGRIRQRAEIADQGDEKPEEKCASVREVC